MMASFSLGTKALECNGRSGTLVTVELLKLMKERGTN